MTAADCGEKPFSCSRRVRWSRATRPRSPAGRRFLPALLAGLAMLGGNPRRADSEPPPVAVRLVEVGFEGTLFAESPVVAQAEFAASAPFRGWFEASVKTEWAPWRRAFPEDFGRSGIRIDLEFATAGVERRTWVFPESDGSESILVWRVCDEGGRTVLSGREALASRSLGSDPRGTALVLGGPVAGLRHRPVPRAFRRRESYYPFALILAEARDLAKLDAEQLRALRLASYRSFVILHGRPQDVPEGFWGAETERPVLVWKGSDGGEIHQSVRRGPFGRNSSSGAITRIQNVEPISARLLDEPATPRELLVRSRDGAIRGLVPRRALRDLSEDSRRVAFEDQIGKACNEEFLRLRRARLGRRTRVVAAFGAPLLLLLTLLPPLAARRRHPLPLLAGIILLAIAGFLGLFHAARREALAVDTISNPSRIAVRHFGPGSPSRIEALLRPTTPLGEVCSISWRSAPGLFHPPIPSERSLVRLRERVDGTSTLEWSPPGIYSLRRTDFVLAGDDPLGLPWTGSFLASEGRIRGRLELRRPMTSILLVRPGRWIEVLGDAPAGKILEVDLPDEPRLSLPPLELAEALLLDGIPDSASGLIVTAASPTEEPALPRQVLPSRPGHPLRTEAQVFPVGGDPLDPSGAAGGPADLVVPAFVGETVVEAYVPSVQGEVIGRLASGGGPVEFRFAVGAHGGQQSVVPRSRSLAAGGPDGFRVVRFEWSSPAGRSGESLRPLTIGFPNGEER